MNKDNAKQFDDLTMNWIKYKWLWIFIFLTLLGLLDIGVLVTDDMADGNQVEWLRYFINEISAVWLLLPLIAVLFWFFRQYPITKSNFKSRLLLHLFVTVLFGTTHTLLMYTIRTPLYHWFGIGAYNSFYGILGYRIVMEYLKQFIFYWVVYGLFTLFKQFREQQLQQIRTAQLEEQLTRSRLQTLQMQLNPHFLFNTLNAISGIMYEDLDAADRMMSNLSDMLRSTFQIKTSEHSLDEEINLINHYLKIMQIRFKDKLDIRISSEDHAGDALLPVFLLQPLLENAIKHGVESKGKIHINLTSKIIQDKLNILLTDDGPGIQRNFGSGIGLKNTMERLENHYGDQFKFEMKNRDEGGLSILIEIPIQKAA